MPISQSKPVSVSYKTMERRPHRTFIKSETQSLWRSKFKERCLRRIKESRVSSANKRRLDFWKISNSSDDEDEVDLDEKELRKWIINEWKLFGDEFEVLLDVDKYINIENELLQEILQDSVLDAEAEFAIRDDNYMSSLLPQECLEDQRIDMMDLDEVVPDNYRTYELDNIKGEESNWVLKNMTCFSCQNQQFLSTDNSKAIYCPNCGFSLKEEAVEQIIQYVREHSAFCSDWSFTYSPATGLLMFCSQCVDFLKEII